MAKQKDFKFDLWADINDLSLHAASPGGVDVCRALEQLWHGNALPDRANHHLQASAVGQAVLRLNTRWHHSTAHVEMSLLQSVWWLKAPSPRWHWPDRGTARHKPASATASRRQIQGDERR
jgi:hypothetical protein